MSRVLRKIYQNKVGWVPNILNVCSLSNSSASNISESNLHYDVVVVGGGIVGTASARELKKRHPNLKMAVVEKEDDLARHQSGHNSGVIHAGIYYKPDSLKAKLCVEGLNLAYEYLDANSIPYKKVGKLIVATNPTEVTMLYDLHERGLKNQVRDLKLIKGEAAIKKFEPNCTGLEALWSPHTGIVDWAVVTKQYGKDFTGSGGEIHFKFEVNDFKKSDDPDRPVLVKSKSGKSVKSKFVLTCAGLQSDYLAQMSGCPREPRIVPFRGEYLLLDKKKAHMVNGNIYPVPDPRFPFLGVHFTPRMNGDIWLGPNAVLAFQREGYKWSDINLKELSDALMYPGFSKMAVRYLSAGAYEMSKSMYTTLQVRELQKFMPSLTRQDVGPGPAGVRAQAVDINGNLVDDFYFDMCHSSKIGDIGDRILHCRNAPSPGATSSLSIAKMMADKMEKEFKLK